MRTFNGFPDSFGAKRASVFPHQGPLSYTQIVEGVAPALTTGGDLCYATEGGMKYIDKAMAGATDSGKYQVNTYVTTPSGVIATPGAVPQPGTSVRLKWTVTATGAEVAALTDLSAEIVRMMAFGPQ